MKTQDFIAFTVSLYIQSLDLQPLEPEMQLDMFDKLPKADQQFWRREAYRVVQMQEALKKELLSREFRKETKELDMSELARMA